MAKINTETKAYLVKIFKFLANEKRLDILMHILEKEHNVKDIKESLGLDVSTVSDYLNRMRIGGIVSARMQGNNMYYKITDGNVKATLTQILEFWKTP